MALSLFGSGEEVNKINHIRSFGERQAIRERGWFRLTTARGSFDVNYRYCHLIHRADGYSIS